MAEPDKRPMAVRIRELRVECEQTAVNPEYTRNRPKEYLLWLQIASALAMAETWARQVPGTPVGGG